MVLTSTLSADVLPVMDETKTVALNLRAPPKPTCSPERSLSSETLESGVKFPERTVMMALLLSPNPVELTAADEPTAALIFICAQG